MKKVLFLFIACLLTGAYAHAQCAPNQKKLKVVLHTDDYPTETAWHIADGSGNIILQSPATLTAETIYVDSVCVDTGTCHTFTITDGAGDGICCNYGHGYFEVFYGGVLVKADSSFGSLSHASVGCPVGQDCSTAPDVTVGTYTTTSTNSWYAFTPGATGQYNVTTCLPQNTCDTKIWIYDYCSNLVTDTSNLATVYYLNDNCGGIHESVDAYFTAGTTYYIRIGQVGTSCAGTGIVWSISAAPVVSGCLDTTACNFNPFATISAPNTCIYYPDIHCPTGADLAIDSTILATSVSFGTFQSTDICSIAEGCVNGYGTREAVYFSTHIANIGATDFYAGIPPQDTSTYSPIYHWDPCHHHWHFTNYAQYLLADDNNNFLPLGYKNGFCVLDLMCSTGFAKFGCGNMGITSGCADEYWSGLSCQWMDVTNVPDGHYKLIVRANWKPRPDYYGRYETNYFNNWAHTCIQLYHDGTGARQVQVLPNCTPFYDCAGVENGLSVPDCNNTCNGVRMTGDVNIDTLRNAIDVSDYMLGSIYGNLSPTPCLDLNSDQRISVVDAALLFDCAKHGAVATPAGQTHEPCVFPDLITNPLDTAIFSITNLDTVNKTFDIAIYNSNCKILGYQLKLSGVHLAANQMQNLVSGYNTEMYSRASGEVIVLTTDESAVPKNQVTAPLLRLSYTSIDSTSICISKVVDVMNLSYERLDSASIGTNCLAATPTPNATATVAIEAVGHKLYPNPTQGATTLLVMDPDKATYTVTVYDVMGKAVRTYSKRRDNAMSIDRGALPTGIYYIGVQSDKWQFKEKLVIE